MERYPVAQTVYPLGFNREQLGSDYASPEDCCA